MNKIKIYFDNTIFRAQKIGGISIVFCELIKLLKLNGALDLHMLLNGENADNLVFESISNDLNIHKEFQLPKVLLPFFPVLRILPKGVIFHTTYTRYSFQKDIKKIITIHDLGYEHGIMRKGLKRAVHLFFKKIAIKNADGIICVSKNTYDDLYHFYDNILQNKIVEVIYNGLSKEYFNFTNNDLSDKSHSILYVGGRQAYKNFEKTVMAVSELKDFNLIIAGGGPMSDQHRKLLDRHLNLRYTIECNLSTEQLKEIYSKSYCLVYPSSYEGFGLPLIEAMASGCPVIACDNSCIYEITGDAAILISKPEIVEIKEAVISLKNESVRRELIEKGRVNAAKFSWENTVRDTMKFYQNI